MKSKIVLSPEQMQELSLMNLDCSDASMCWVANKINNEFTLETRSRGSYLLKTNLLLRYQYAYTLEDIINKLPSTIDGYDLRVTKNDVRYADGYTVDSLKCFWDNSVHIIDNAFNMLKWVHEKYPDRIKFLE